MKQQRPAAPFSVTRRSTLSALASLAGSTVLAPLTTSVRAQAAPHSELFRHGVASGDPDQTSVVLWTRISADGQQQGSWQLARDSDFAMIERSGEFSTGPDVDHTVKLLVEGLGAGVTYYYRFTLGEELSPVGRTRTLPGGELDRLGIALASCSNYAFGFFNAYDAIANDAAVDFVLHTGDYIYEYGQDGWGDAVAQTLARRHEPEHEIVTLADYRTRHAQYKSDAGSLAMHAAHPLLVCWDDHESANNPWTGGAQNHQPETEGNWEERRAASIQAYYEWMPIREPDWLPQRGRSHAQFWRSYRFGNLATLCTLETRHTARAQQIEYLDYLEQIDDAEDARRLVQDIIGAPDRAMLDPLLEADLNAALGESVATGQPWRLIGNPMPIARTLVPDVVALGLLPDPATTEDMADAARFLAWKGKWNLPFYPDTWDGYPWAREKLYELARKAGASDLVFLTGDSHSFWANLLADAAGQPVGIELGTAGITSPGDFIDRGFAEPLAAQLDQAFTDHNDEIVWTDNLHQGYVLLELSHAGGTASIIVMDTVREPVYQATTLVQFALTREEGALALQQI